MVCFCSEKIHKLQGEIKSVRLDNDRLKSLADVAAKQMDSIRFINVSQEKEVMSLRKQVGGGGAVHAIPCCD